MFGRKGKTLMCDNVGKYLAHGKKESRNIGRSTILAAVKNGVKKYKLRLIMVSVRYTYIT